MKKFKHWIKEENTQGDIGTPKLTAHRKRLTPGEKQKTPEPLKNYEIWPDKT